ncbi:MAG: dinitrogenase iron-molybdenum cofactor biosynthesis protein [bacterium]|nr:dinitrogenase iron-molybdenum cofactor biosynthesis protein [bacterium]
MVAALPLLRKRIAPVFDEAGEILVVRVMEGRAQEQTIRKLPSHLLPEKIDSLTDLGVTVLICGAISCAAEAMVAARGIQVCPFIAGSVDEVLQAWLAGRPLTQDFTMPGCGRHRRRGRRR